MNTEVVDLNTLIPEDDFRISIPSDPGLHEIFSKRFPGIPPIVINPGKVIISGYDSYDFMITNNVEQSEVFVTNIETKEGLFLGYNSRAAIKPLSIYEKLNFLKNITKFTNADEIYERTHLGIRIDENLISLLSELTIGLTGELLTENRISLKTALRLCTYSEENKKELAGIFSNVSFSSSNELNLLDMISDLCFREKTNVKSILKLINSEALYEEKDASTALLSGLSRLRYPSFTDHENEWNSEIGKIKIPFKHSIHHSPFFEKKSVELKLFLDSIEKIKQISEKLRD